MSQQNKTTYLRTLGTVELSGNVLRRTADSASLCHNFRVMPGRWLRTWGGRKARLYQASGEWRHFHEYRDPQYSGWPNHVAQHYSSGPTVKWQWLSLNNFLVVDIETIDGTYDGGWCQSNRAAICNLRDRIILYNGKGVISGSGSVPPFSMYFPSNGLLMYCGLHAYTAGSSAPQLAYAFSGSVTITAKRKVYVGLYNAFTGHFSNGIYCGEIPACTNRRIDISLLTNIKYAYHDLIEKGYLQYVVYVTEDGGEVPYPLMADAITPLAVSVTVDSISINTISDIYGPSVNWIDTTREMPTVNNYPPRPMRWLTAVQGRLYGCLLAGGSGQAEDFTYVPNIRFLSGIVYSVIASDITDQGFLGSPEESWPPDNFSPSPNGEIPLWGSPTPDGFALLVQTATHTFIVEEAADKVHEWEQISPIHGISRGETCVDTSYGKVWLTQRNEVVLLPKGSRELQVISVPYQPLLAGKTPRFATYTLDPLNAIDRVEFYFTDGTGVVHDFTAGGGYTIDGDYTSGATLTQSGTNKTFHLLAKQHIYSQAGQPEDGLERVANEDFTDALHRALTGISGSWQGQWMLFEESQRRTELPFLSAIGDIENLSLKIASNFDLLPDGFRAADKSPHPQLPSSVIFRVSARFQNAFKLWLQLQGRTDYATHLTALDFGGEVKERKFLGSILEAGMDASAGDQK